MSSSNGKNYVDSLKYTIIETTDLYEIWKYAPSLVAQFRYQSKGDDNSFQALAKYIGVFGTPENLNKKGAHTPISMTAPVISDSNSMKFVLPIGYTLENTPKPTNVRIELVVIPERVMIVQTYSGLTTYDEAAEKVKILYSQVND